MRAPRAANFSGYLRNSTISTSSCFASSTPATSPNVRVCLLPVKTRARLLPKLIAWLFDPWACLIMNTRRAPKTMTGRNDPIIPSQEVNWLGSRTSTLTCSKRTPFWFSRSRTSVLSDLMATLRPSLVSARSRLPCTTRVSTRFCFASRTTIAIRSVIGTCVSRDCGLNKVKKIARTATMITR